MAAMADDSNSNRWNSIFIVSLWTFIRQLWKNRNSVVHSKNVEEAANIILQEVNNKIRQHYACFDQNDVHALPRHAYLFTQCTLQHPLQVSYDFLTCWL
jgi:hypothetical protein